MVVGQQENTLLDLMHGAIALLDDDSFSADAQEDAHPRQVTPFAVGSGGSNKRESRETIEEK